MKNTSENQTHIVIDRFNVGHELRPGEAREMEMLNDEITSFQEQRRPEQFYPGTTTLKPVHPIVIEGVASMLQVGGHYEGPPRLSGGAKCHIPGLRAALP